MNDLLIKNPVLIVGIGGAGSKIARTASRTVGCQCLVISNDKKDLDGRDERVQTLLVESRGWVNPTSYKLRSFAQLHESEILSAMNGFQTVIVISNLAGRSGTAIAPLVCRSAKDLNGSVVITIAVMPFRFENDRLFNAGTTLRRIRETSDSVIVMDNDAFLENNPELSQEECYSVTNNAIVEIIGSISSSGMRPEVNVLCTSKSGTDAESSLRDSVSMLYQNVPDPGNLKRALVYVMGGEKVPVGELNNIVGCVRSMFKEDGGTQVALSTLASQDGVRVHLIASAPQKTRFDRYDPLGDIIPKENFLDWEDPDSAPDIKLPIHALE